MAAETITKEKKKVIFIKLIKTDILNSNYIHNIFVFTVFWSNKCSFGEHKGFTDPTFFNSSELWLLCVWKKAVSLFVGFPNIQNN